MMRNSEISRNPYAHVELNSRQDIWGEFLSPTKTAAADEIHHHCRLKLKGGNGLLLGREKEDDPDLAGEDH